MQRDREVVEFARDLIKKKFKVSKYESKEELTVLHQYEYFEITYDEFEDRLTKIYKGEENEVHSKRNV